MKLSDVFLNHPELLSDQKKLRSVFADYYENDTATINRMLKAYEIGILDTLQKEDQSPFEKQILIDKLVSQHDMMQDKADEAIEEWYAIANASVINAYKNYIFKKKQEEIAEQQKKKTIEIQTESFGREQEIAEKVGDLLNNHDDYQRYLNLDLSKGKVVRGIPCGVGDSDYGFIVKGTGTENTNSEKTYSSLQALVYNFLIRDSHIQRENYPQYMYTHFFNHELDYGHVYRYMMILLDLLNPTGKTKLRLNILEDRDEVQAAVDILNEYLSVFSRLIKADECQLEIMETANGKTIAVDSKADYCVENLKHDCGLKRRIRYGSRINYKLDETNREDLEFLLREISPFKKFKRGQFEALCSMMNANGHAVCIMPTGSGKSLIYYFASILQPQVVFVVSPTDILIRDQIRNLRKIHHFDNVTHLDLNSDNDFSFFRPGTNLIFLTPSTFQNRNLFGVFKRLKKEISYVVLDEIHCLSNWGHDFRPEYLMLSKNMSNYLGDARYLGFTATANYTVAQDIEKQLHIPQGNFFSPVLFEKYNVRYDFREVETTENMYEQVKQIADDIVRRNERGIVFTKSDEISVKVAEAIGFEADVFTRDNLDSYNQFADGYCKILVANEELGIGVNLPNVNCTVHFGMPVSKNEFVQEIGRAGRSDEKVTSYVIYLKPSKENILPELLKRETTVDNLPQILSNMGNDYSDIYHKLNCGADTSDILYERLIDIFSDFHVKKKPAYIVQRSSKNVEAYKQYLYMLYVTGYIKDWYTYRALKNNEIEIIVDICSVPDTGHHVVALRDKEILSRMKNVSRDYFASMDNDRESIFNVSRAKNIQEVIKIYVKWYYEKFLYHHKEQFLDFYDFITNNKECDSVKITEEIEDYFILPFIQIKEDEDFYSNMSFSEISEQIVKGVGKNTLSNIERINSNAYSYTLDFMLFIGNWNRFGRFEAARLERFWNQLSIEERSVLFDTLATVYQECGEEAKWNCLKYIDSSNNVTDITLAQFCDQIYKDTKKDKLYYGILAKCANAGFQQFMRR